MGFMSHRPFRLEEAVAVLERTPAALRTLLAGLPETWLRATEGEGTWSPYDVVGHLVHAERTNWIPRLKHLLAGDDRPFPVFDREGQFAAGQGKSLLELLDELGALRELSLETLRALNLGEDDLGKQGLHPELGAVRVGQLLATWVVHDLDHVAQIVRTMAKVYSGAVGPWSAYLSILRDRR